MSYLALPRLTVSGQFQADISTVNNDVRHFDNAYFEPRFQEFQTRTEDGHTLLNGWFNPEGTGSFRLVDVRVRRAAADAGADATSDGAVGLSLDAQIGRSAAKLVDIDPQWQLCSMIFGLRVVLRDGETEIMRADFMPAAFRDLFFGRVQGQGGDGGASAKFTSVLTDVEWGCDDPALAARSPTLVAMKEVAAANGGCLSINLLTYGYQGSASQPSFTFGRLAGCIGPWREGEPKTFVRGRRFAPAQSQTATPAGIGFFDGAVADDRVAVDLGNALPLASGAGVMKNLGPLELVVLRTADAVEHGTRPTIRAWIDEGDSVTAKDYVALGPVPYRDPHWLAETAGVAEFALDDDSRRLVGDHPLALVGPGPSGAGSETVFIRETRGGVFTRVDDFEQRIDTLADGAVERTLTAYAARFGEPYAEATITLELQPPTPGLGGSGLPDEYKAPQAEIPKINDPASALTLPRTVVTTGPDGTAAIAIRATDPGNPRGYMDGQIYIVNYDLDIEDGSPMQIFDTLVLHVRDAYPVPDIPQWATHVAPIMIQYGNLYPVMSKGLFGFAEPAVLREHARILHFAFTRPFDDPNYMPVTRDLSAGKQATIVKWLERYLPETPPATVDLPSPCEPAPAPVTAPVTAAVGSAHAAVDLEPLVADGDGGKSRFVRAYLAARRPPSA